LLEHQHRLHGCDQHKEDDAAGTRPADAAMDPTIVTQLMFPFPARWTPNAEGFPALSACARSCRFVTTATEGAGSELNGILKA
jgi:hypothetical protein